LALDKLAARGGRDEYHAELFSARFLLLLFLLLLLSYHRPREEKESEEEELFK